MATLSQVNAKPFKKAGSGAIEVVDGRVVKMHRVVMKPGVSRLVPNPYVGKRDKFGEIQTTPTNNTK